MRLPWRKKRGDEYNAGGIRELLLHAFTPAELRRFCQDRKEFSHFLTYFKQDSSLQDMVDTVIDQCQTKDLTSTLLREVERINRRQFKKHERGLYRSRPSEESERPIDTGREKRRPEPPGEPTELEPGPPPAEEANELAAMVLGLGAINRFALADQHQAVLCTDQGTLLLELRTQEELWKKRLTPEQMAVAPDCGLLAFANDSEVVLRDLRSGNIVGSPLVVEDKIISMVFSPKKPQLALQFLDERIERYDVPGWKRRKPLIPDFRNTIDYMRFLLRTMPPGNHPRIAFSSDRQWLAALQGGRVALWSLTDGVRVRWIGDELRILWCLAFEPRSTLVASGCKDGQVLVHQTANGDRVHDFVTERWTKPGVTSLAFSPDGKLLAAATGPDYVFVRLWDLVTGRASKPIQVHTDSISGIAFMQNGKVLVSAGFDGAVRFTHLDQFGLKL